MLLIFKILTLLIRFSRAVDQRAWWKLAWLPWWIISWQQTWVRCPFGIFQACQQLLIKLVKWFLLAHLYILGGTAKNHSARPSLFGEGPVSRVACGWSVLRTRLVLASFGLLSWLKCVNGIAEVAMAAGWLHWNLPSSSQARSLMPHFCITLLGPHRGPPSQWH